MLFRSNMGDDGLAAGAAWLSHLQRVGTTPERFETALLGPAPTEAEVLHELKSSGLAYTRPADMEDRVAELKVRWDTLPSMPAEYAAALTRRYQDACRAWEERERRQRFAARQMGQFA